MEIAKTLVKKVAIPVITPTNEIVRPSLLGFITFFFQKNVYQNITLGSRCNKKANRGNCSCGVIFFALETLCVLFFRPGYPPSGIIGHEEFIVRNSRIIGLLQNELQGNIMAYDRALKNLKLDCVLTLPSKKEVKAFVEEFEEYGNMVKVWQQQRATIERVFGIVVNKWMILKNVFRGRGDFSIERLNEIIILAMQLTNIAHRFEVKLSGRKHLANKQNLSFDELLMRL